MGEPIRLVTGRPLREDFAAAGVDADAFVQQEIDWYDGSIRAMDVELGRIVETLNGAEEDPSAPGALQTR